MGDCKNYVVVFYNKRFHDQNEADKNAYINHYIRELIIHYGRNLTNVQIKEICFNKKNEPIAYVYFYADGNAQQIAEAFSEQVDTNNPYDFKIKLGKDKINAPLKHSNDENNNVGSPRPIIIDGNNVALSHGMGEDNERGKANNTHSFVLKTNIPSSGPVSRLNDDETRRNRNGDSDDRETNLFVGNLNKDVSNNELYELFKNHCKRLIIDSDIRNTRDKNRKYAIVKFRDQYSAQLAIDKLNGKEISYISAPKMTLSVKYFN